MKLGKGWNQASELQALLEADNAAAKVSVSALPGLVDRGELPGAQTEFSPIGVTLETAVPKNVDAVATGRARVQDEGSALVALALAQVEAPAGNWADLCAGPGGKAAVLAAIAKQQGGALDAFDSSEHRVELVRSSTQALDNVTTRVQDARDATGPYAKVLVDVPCSGLGALRRRPEARYRRRPEDINALAPAGPTLRAALDACAPGGVVVAPVLPTTQRPCSSSTMSCAKQQYVGAVRLRSVWSCSVLERYNMPALDCINQAAHYRYARPHRSVTRSPAPASWCTSTSRKLDEDP